MRARTLPDLVPETRAQVRFVLMNSFSTSDDTKAHLRKKHAELVDEPDSELVQNKSPKIDAGSLAPAQYPDHPDMEWCELHLEAVRLALATTEEYTSRIQIAGVACLVGFRSRAPAEYPDQPNVVVCFFGHV